MNIFSIPFCVFGILKSFYLFGQEVADFVPVGINFFGGFLHEKIRIER